MKHKCNRIKNIIFPNKKINYVVIMILFLGVISGSIFTTIINQNDKQLVIDKIQLLISNINTNSLNSILAFKNSISINMLYTTIIWIFGMTFIGVIINIFILYLKGFIFGFSLGSFILAYNYKGIILSILYTLFGQTLNLLVVSILTIYSLMFITNFIKEIKKNKENTNIKRFFKNYFIIFIIAIFISIISSVSETFIFPTLIKIIIKLFT